jgi:hypothetical protein
MHTFAGMYGEAGMDYGDNLFRMALFAWASLEVCMHEYVNMCARSMDHDATCVALVWRYQNNMCFS